MEQKYQRFMLFTIAIVASLLGAFARSTASAQSFGRRMGISHHTLPALANATFLSQTSRGRQLDIAVGLNAADTAALNARIEQISDRNSPLYHQFLTPAQFADQFGPSQGDYEAVVNYLTANGLTVTAVYPNRLVVEAHGNVTQVEQAFGVKINDYIQGNQVFFANDRDPQLPPAIASVVSSVKGMENYLALHHHARLHANSHAHGASTPTGFTPQQIATAYDFNAVYNQGYTGGGQTIAIATAYGFSPTDVAKFWNNYGIPAPKYSTVAIGGATRYIDTETTLDLEQSGAMANGATFIVYEAATPSLSTFESVYNKIVSDNKASVVTTSWGLCEQQMPSAYLKADSAIFAEATLQGQTWFAAAGDSGSNDCGTSTLAVDYPSSDPNVGAVGGTSLTLTDGGAIASESAWSGSGGGVSTVFTQPTYQTGPGVSNSGKRQTSDIAFNANPSTGYPVYFNGSWAQYGGTSFGAPHWAAIFALVNSAHGNRIGAAGPTLYGLANNQPVQKLTAFHDIVNGSNGHYTAGTTWDAPTGWGSPDVNNLVQDLK
jgi:kumamolisin